MGNWSETEYERRVISHVDDRDEVNDRETGVKIAMSRFGYFKGE